MLYVTTRNNRDAFTANRAITENRCPDGGHYLPFRHPKFSPEEMDTLLQKPFGEVVAEVINRLFSVKLNGWDVDFSIGRHPVRLEPLHHRILLAEGWHVPGNRFDQIQQFLSQRICPEMAEPSGWVKIAIRSAILFGVFADLRRIGIKQADFSCISGDFIMPISAWYARCWGLPIRNIICCCNENNSLWELLCHGQMRMDLVSTPTLIPDADVTVPVHLERLIYECGGMEENQRYLDACRKGRRYIPTDAVLAKMRQGMHVSVVSSHRLRSSIPSVYKSYGQLLSCKSALAYSGLQDFQSINGIAGNAIVWSEESPVTESDSLAQILSVPADTIGALV